MIWDKLPEYIFENHPPVASRVFSCVFCNVFENTFIVKKVYKWLFLKIKIFAGASFCNASSFLL